jgi:propionyl-CoA synthetase
MRSIADGEDYKAPATIDDPAILDEITEALKERGVAKAG